MPFNAETTATRQALPKPEILAYPLDTPVLDSVVLRAAGVEADASGVYEGRRYLLAGTVLVKRGDSRYDAYGGGTVNEVQSLEVTDATGGTFKLTYDGQETAGIAFDANAAAVKTALEALSNLAEGDVVVSGGPLNTAPVTIEFAGTLADADVTEITVSEDALTGDDAAIDIETTTEGEGVIAGILFDTVEFADATQASDEPAAMVRKDLSLDQNKIVGFEDYEAELLAWAAEHNVEFVNVTNAQE